MQETVITVAKNIDKLKYDPAIGSFKGWLLQITRWRIADQFRKREPGNAKRRRSADDRDVIYGFRCVLAAENGSEIENK